MAPAEFDELAAQYETTLGDNIRASGETPAFFAAYKVVDMRRDWDRRPDRGEPARILDFGGGIGAAAPFLRRHFPHSALTIADVSQRSLDIAARRGVDGLTCLHFDGATLPLDDASQDIVLASCVFHHVPADSQVALLRQLLRVLASGGCLFVFEHNPWNPLTVHAVNSCPLDTNAVLISAPTMRRRLRAAGCAGSRMAIRYRIFFPHALRALRRCEPWMTAIPLGAQYYARVET